MPDEDRYRNREIDMFHREINDKLEKILIQTTATNGRVSSIETWKNKVNGALVVISAVLLPLAFIVLQMYLWGT